LISFGLRPAELKGLELLDRDGQLCAVVTNEKKSSKGKGGARIVPAIPPGSWPVDCHGLLARWQENGLPSHVTNHRSPGEVMGQQLSRLKQVSSLDKNLVPYGCRHAFALRLGIDLSLSVREAAELMGHSPQVHLSTYGRRIDQPKLEAKVRLLLEKRKMEAIA
jgi:integrase